ncbi:pilus assembly protein PilM [Desulfonatronovibrio hydrogenovorans]|uniref:pilus assembly protein PilM n=1 Tax=Desulfonatronovibrio hydrogenovorans TaxID=53245 RepID=UPI0012371608|nr:pilus assembly protein PilM [Desulfonatronovibrio hydrogenovorans]
MARENELSSTENLLNLIRKKNQDNQSGNQARLKKQGRKRFLSSLDLFRNRNLFPVKNKDILGVDISGHLMNLARVRRTSSGWKLVKARVFSIPSGLTFDNPDFPSFLKRCFSEFVGQDSQVSIWTMTSPAKAEIWSVKVPWVKKGLDNAVFWTAVKEKGFNKDEYLFDYQIMADVAEGHVKKKLACAYIVSRSELFRVKEVFSKSGYQLDGITTSSFAFRNMFAGKLLGTAQEPFAVMHIGHDSTRIDLFEQDRLLLSRLVKTGIESLTESLDLEKGQDQSWPGPEASLEVDHLKQPGKQDTSTKKAYEYLASMIKDPGTDALDKRSLIAPVLRRLVRQVERTLNHFVNVQGHKPVKKILIAGLPAGLPGVTDFFSQQLAIDTEQIDPFRFVSPLFSSTASLDRFERSSLSLATALAISDNNITPNFLFTADNRRDQVLSGRINMLAAVLGMAAVLAAGAYLWVGTQQLSAKKAELSVLSSQVEELDFLVNRDLVQSLSSELQVQKTELNDLINNYKGIAVMSELVSLIPDNIKLLSFRLDLDKALENQTRKLEGMVTLNGLVQGEPAMLDASLSGFLFKLKRSPLFDEVRIHASNNEYLSGHGQVLRFVINIGVGET